MEQKDNFNQEREEQILDIRSIIYFCISKWYWFAISIVLAVAIAFLYIKTVEPSYSTSAEIQIKSDSKGNSMSGEDAFTNMGFFKSNTNVWNEIIAFSSPDLMVEVVERLKLHTDYRKPGLFYDKLLYGTSLPVIVSMPELPDNAVVSFT